MRIALCSDERYPIHQLVSDVVRGLGHEVMLSGALAGGREQPWAEVAERAALDLVEGRCDEGIFFCWSGTGISMAANKVAGIRAALCVDAQTATAARVWNHANVLCLSNRLLSEDVAKEILSAWFAPYDAAQGAAGVEALRAVEARSFERP
jgi:ribose 5-phosphate isomerase B